MTPKIKGPLATATPRGIRREAQALLQLRREAPPRNTPSLYHSVPANEAQTIVESLVTRRAPVVQDFAGFLKILNPVLLAGDYALVLLYQRGKDGANYAELESWSKPKMRSNLRTTLTRLVDDRAFVHFDGARYFITLSGMKDVETRKLYEAP